MIILERSTKSSLLQILQLIILAFYLARSRPHEIFFADVDLTDSLERSEPHIELRDNSFYKRFKLIVWWNASELILYLFFIWKNLYCNYIL